MKITKHNQLSFIIISSTLLTGLGPGSRNNPISALFIIIFLFFEFINKDNFNLKINVKSIFILPLFLLLIFYIAGIFNVINGLSYKYVFDRLIMCSIFIIYAYYLNQFSIKDLISASVKSCLIIFPFYLIESLLIITSPNILISIRKILGLRSVYLPNLIVPHLGHHEPSQMAITILFIVFTYLVLLKHNKDNINFQKSNRKKISFLFFLTLLYFSGTYITSVVISGGIVGITIILRILIKKKILKVNLLRLKNFLIILFLIISLFFSGFNYIFTKIEISRTGDISTIARSYQLFRAISDLKRTYGLGTGPGTYETVTKESNIAILEDFSFLKNYFYYTDGVLEKEYLENRRIPFYSIIGKITSELGIIGFSLISLPFIYVIFIYFKELIYSNILSIETIQIYFFSIGSYLVMIAGGLRGSIIQWLIIIISLKLLDYKNKHLLKYKE